MIQHQRARKIARTLAAEADIPYKPIVVEQIVAAIDSDPDKWHASQSTPLNGRGIVKFLRRTTKNYFRSALKSVSIVSETEAKEALHTAAIIDASLSGTSIKTNLDASAATNDLNIRLNRHNPVKAEIIKHYRRFLREQLSMGDVQRHAVNALYRETVDSPEQIVRDVELLWSVFDQSAKDAFHAAEKHKHDSASVQFLDTILRPFREDSARNEGHREGMEYINDILHGWANKLLVAILVIVGAGAKIGCPKCRKCTACTPKGSGSQDAKDKIVNQAVFTIGKSVKLYIEEKNKYTRISTRGHPDYYTKNRTGQILKANAKHTRRAGRINEHGHYEPSFNDDTNVY
jgi:hypothetical protein